MPKNRNNTVILHSAMRSDLKRLGILQTNLENVDSIAFKAINPDSILFSELMEDMFRNDDQGEMVTTGRSLDLALTHEKGYFLVENGNGPERTRDGQFHLNADGKIVNFEGKELVVLDKSQDHIKVADVNAIKIAPDGSIMVRNKFFGRVAIDYENKMPGDIAYVSQGRLETSNVDISEHIMKVTQLKRHVDTLQSMLSLDLIADKSLMETYGRNV